VADYDPNCISCQALRIVVTLEGMITEHYYR
jgi:hypothetical protein